MQVIQVKEDMVMVLMDGKNLPPFPSRSSTQDFALKTFLFFPGSLKLVTPEGAPAPGLRIPEIPMTEAVEAVGMCWMGGPRVKGGSSVTSGSQATASSLAMVEDRLQAFWKHGVQVWAPDSKQVGSFSSHHSLPLILNLCIL